MRPASACRWTHHSQSCSASGEKHSPWNLENHLGMGHHLLLLHLSLYIYIVGGFNPHEKCESQLGNIYSQYMEK